VNYLKLDSSQLAPKQGRAKKKEDYYLRNRFSPSTINRQRREREKRFNRRRFGKMAGEEDNMIRESDGSQRLSLTLDEIATLINRSLMNTTLNASTTSSMSMNGNFAKCRAVFGGEKDEDVDAFVDTISTFKDSCNVSEANALKGIPLLLKSKAATWWQGVRPFTTTFDEAVTSLKGAFGRVDPDYLIYRRIFCTIQQKGENTDIFVAVLRSMFSKLKTSQVESVQIDMIHGGILLEIRKVVQRETIKSFEDLIRECRIVERNMAEATTIIDVEDSKPLEKKTSVGNKPSDQQKKYDYRRERPTKKCYGCNKPGFTRSTCPDCSKIVRTAALYYSGYSSSANIGDERPILQIEINGVAGCAIADTGATGCVASTSMYKFLESIGTKFDVVETTLTLADGLQRE